MTDTTPATEAARRLLAATDLEDDSLTAMETDIAIVARAVLEGDAERGALASLLAASICHGTGSDWQCVFLSGMVIRIKRGHPA